MPRRKVRKRRPLWRRISVRPQTLIFVGLALFASIATGLAAVRWVEPQLTTSAT